MRCVHVCCSVFRLSPQLKQNRVKCVKWPWRVVPCEVMGHLQGEGREREGGKGIKVGHVTLYHAAYGSYSREKGKEWEGRGGEEGEWKRGNRGEGRRGRGHMVHVCWSFRDRHTNSACKVEQSASGTQGVIKWSAVE